MLDQIKFHPALMPEREFRMYLGRAVDQRRGERFFKAFEKTFIAYRPGHCFADFLSPSPRCAAAHLLGKIDVIAHTEMKTIEINTDLFRHSPDIGHNERYVRGQSFLYYYG